MHHYNFPPYSVGEVRPMRGPGRREIGHGALAERALEPVIPSEDDFPYAIRLVSEVMSSNGSTSMASVCGSTLALMDAGVPLKAPVAGIAMGLIMGEDGNYQVLTDIAGQEDFMGDMDFKVAGTRDGITALQMDIKIGGVSRELLAARPRPGQGRPRVPPRQDARSHLRARARRLRVRPAMYRINIQQDQIGTIIGPGGKMVRKIQEESGGATIDIQEDGTVFVGGITEAVAAQGHPHDRRPDQGNAGRRDLHRQGHAHSSTSARSWRSFPARKASSTSRSSAKTTSSASKTKSTSATK